MGAPLSILILLGGGVGMQLGPQHPPPPLPPRSLKKSGNLWLKAYLQQ